MPKHLLRVLNLGKRSFADALRTQEMIRQRVILQSSGAAGALSPAAFDSDIGVNTLPNDNYPGEPENFLLLVEHWPVYTAGLRDKALTENDANKLKALGADVCRTNRGGLVTFHGPGQLVAYPIINLKTHGFGLKEYVTRLENTLISTCKESGVEAYSDSTGVWTNGKKIASIGVNAKRYVTLHGVALNCSTDLSWYDHIKPCGLEGVEMTSLSQETGSKIDVSGTTWHFLNSFSKNFQTCLSSVSDYVPAAISCSKDEPINARVF